MTIQVVWMIDKTIKGVGCDITYMSLSFFERILLQSNVTSYLLFVFLNFMKLEKKKLRYADKMIM